VATSNENNKDNRLILDNECKTRPDIIYPTKWSYKLIGRDLNALIASVKEIMQDRPHTCTQGNRSKNGKFHSYNTTCTVTSEEERNQLFKAFEEHKDVEMVI
jgi:putative lipoic acid-binding regulatory protein